MELPRLNVQDIKDLVEMQPIAPQQKIKRPLNSFMLYKRDKKDEIIRNNPGINFREVVRQCGEAWKREDEDLKEQYRRKALDLQIAHNLKYPGYKYPSSISKKRKGMAAGTDGMRYPRLLPDFRRFSDENLEMKYSSLIKLDTKNFGQNMVIPNSPKDQTLPTLLSPIAFSFERDPALNEFFSSWEYSSFAQESITSKPAVRNKCIGSSLIAHIPGYRYPGDL